VGIGRSYAKVEGELTFEKWVQAIADGRSYISDGFTHLMDFRAKHGETTYEVGVNGSEIRLAKPGKCTFRVQAASLQRGRKSVPVELIVNGVRVAQQELPSDGETRELTFTTEIPVSSWVALRVTPSGHTNPFFVIVGDKPIRVSKHSAQWCLAGVDQCWKMKANTYAKEEREQAEADYQHARETYRRIEKECER
jgi:hypothetical protein